MSTVATQIQQSPAERKKSAATEPLFGANEMRLGPWEWAITIVIVAAAMIAIPRLWEKYEPLKAGPDYRIPYALSNDYPLWQRRLEETPAPGKILLLGDSVVWGEYVTPDGTLSHFLNEQDGRSSRFVNCGMNGLYPLALEGLVRNYGGALRNRKVIVHWNVLWMSDPKADLSARPQKGEEEPINHSRLLPQFWPQIPSYAADANERLSAVIEPHVSYIGWTTHLQCAYFGSQSIPKWTLEEDGERPPGFPNAWRNPLPIIEAGIPGEPAHDPQRGRSSRRHRAWEGDPIEFKWVPLENSLQWQGFQRLIQLLRERGNDVLVIVGPFNEHMIAPAQRPAYQTLRKTTADRLAGLGAAVILPPLLPTELYADASHPLTEGYEKLAKALLGDGAFRAFVALK